MKMLTIPKDYSDTYGSIDRWIPDSGDGNVVNKLTFRAENPTEEQLEALENRLNKLIFNPIETNSENSMSLNSQAKSTKIEIFNFLYFDRLYASYIFCKLYICNCNCKPIYPINCNIQWT